MRTDEIRELGTDDIASRIRDLQEERFRLRFRAATEPLEEPLRVRAIRKDIARLQTILKERELGIAREAKAEPVKPAKKTTRRGAKKGASKSTAR